MTILRVTLLGTSAAQPTERRGLSAAAVRAHGDRFLVDCGEGTQRQLLRFGVGFRLDYVLFTHFHADHYLGIVGFLRTLSMGEREEPLTLYGPGPQVHTLLKKLVTMGIEKLNFPVEFHELSPNDVVDRGEYKIRAVRVDHRVPTLGYVVDEPARPGVFDVDKAQELGVPPGPLFGQLQRGQVVTTPGGQAVSPAQVLGPSRPGRRVVFSGDTRPCDTLAEAANRADLLVHEATFGEREQQRARQTKHATAAEAATIAGRGEVKRLVLTHLSTRYDMSPELLKREARRRYEGPLQVAEDGLSLEISLREA